MRRLLMTKHLTMKIHSPLILFKMKGILKVKMLICWIVAAVPAEDEQSKSINLLTQRAKDSLIENSTIDQRAEFTATINPEVVVKMDLSIEDYSQEKLLPSFKSNRPGADYFNSSLNIST